MKLFKVKNLIFLTFAILIFLGIYSCSHKREYNPNLENNTVSSETENEKEDSASSNRDNAETEKKSTDGKINGEDRLKNAYPDKIKEIKNNTIFFTDGTSMTYDDGKQKDFVTTLDNSDPEDMFHLEYNPKEMPPGYQHDVGRTRSEQLFKTLYGKSEDEVRKQLVSVPWFGGNVSFSSSNNAALQLEKVYKELKQHPELEKYLKSAGTFYWRNVRGANRLSAHSYGIAIDIGNGYNNYWLWSNKGADENQEIKYENNMPVEIAEIFEKYGFVWGGRWYHYDTMHFEYRPELNPPKP